MSEQSDNSLFRNKAALESEMANLGGRVLYLDKPLPTPAEKVAGWNKVMGHVSPQAVWDAATGHNKNMCIWLSNKPSSTILFKYEHKDITASFRLNSTTPLDQTKRVEISDVAVYRSLREDDDFVTGTNVGRLMQMDMFKLLKTCYPNLEQITMGTERIGTYYWTRMGLERIKDDENLPGIFHTDELKRRLSSRLQSVAEQLPPDRLRFLQLQIDSTDTKALWNIADMRDQISVPATDPDTNKPMKFMPAPGTRIAVGKYLLLGQECKGVINLHDPQTQQRMHHYFASLFKELPDDKPRSLRILLKDGKLRHIRYSESFNGNDHER